MKKGLWGFAIFMCGFTAFAGINVFFRDFSADPDKATSNLALGLVCAALTILCIRKGFFPKSKPKTFQKSVTPPAQRPVASVAPRQPAVNAAEKAVIDAMESQLSRMMTQSVMVETHSDDLDENVRTPKGAEISYLDAQALNFWDGRRTDFEIPAHYSESAFGRNVGSALKRLLHGGYLDIGSMNESINLKKVPELKTILADKGLKVSGNKPDLVQRLLDNLTSDELNTLFPVSVYHITEKGEAALEPYSILFANRNHALGFSTYRLLQEKQQNPKASNEEIFTNLLLMDLDKSVKNGNTTEYLRFASKTAQYFRECGRYESALEYNILAYFMWSHVTDKSAVIWDTGNGGYLAMSIDHDGQKCGFTFDELVSFFSKTLQKHNPFGLCTRVNIQNAINSFKKALSMVQ